MDETDALIAAAQTLRPFETKKHELIRENARLQADISRASEKKRQFEEEAAGLQKRIEEFNQSILERRKLRTAVSYLEDKVKRKEGDLVRLGKVIEDAKQGAEDAADSLDAWKRQELEATDAYVVSKRNEADGIINRARDVILSLEAKEKYLTEERKELTDLRKELKTKRDKSDVKEKELAVKEREINRRHAELKDSAQKLEVESAETSMKLQEAEILLERAHWYSNEQEEELQKIAQLHRQVVSIIELRKTETGVARDAAEIKRRASRDAEKKSLEQLDRALESLKDAEKLRKEYEDKTANWDKVFEKEITKETKRISVFYTQKVRELQAQLKKVERTEEQAAQRLKEATNKQTLANDLYQQATGDVKFADGLVKEAKERTFAVERRERATSDKENDLILREKSVEDTKDVIKKNELVQVKREEYLNKYATELSLREQVVVAAEEQTQMELRDAEHAKQETERILERTRGRELEIAKDRVVAGDELSGKTGQLEKMKLDLVEVLKQHEMRKENLIARELEMQNREIALQDREQTLARAFEEARQRGVFDSKQI